MGLGRASVTGTSQEASGEHLRGPEVILTEPPAPQQGRGARPSPTLGLPACGALTGPSWVAAGKQGPSVVFGSPKRFVSAWGKRPACWQGCFSSAVPRLPRVLRPLRQVA